MEKSRAATLSAAVPIPWSIVVQTKPSDHREPQSHVKWLKHFQPTLASPIPLLTMCNKEDLSVHPNCFKA
jgi:hypothetical protein